jgi:high-affinity nickel permease
MEVAQAAVSVLGLKGGAAKVIANFSLTGWAGYVLVGMFLAAWVGALVIYKAKRMEAA